MSRKTNPDAHIICGKCGCATMMNYNLRTEVIEDGVNEYTIVYLTCNNCHTITSLNELIPETI